EDGGEAFALPADGRGAGQRRHPLGPRPRGVPPLARSGALPGRDRRWLGAIRPCLRPADAGGADHRRPRGPRGDGDRGRGSGVDLPNDGPGGRLRSEERAMATVERMKAQIGERARALAAVLLGIRKQFGEGSLMVLGEAARPVEVISTGSLAVDRALGCGGLPRGRVVEIYGAESSGKTTLALLSIARCQAEGGVAAFVDAEHALDPGYARRIGVDLDGLLISQPDCGEQALEITDALVRSNAV